MLIMSSISSFSQDGELVLTFNDFKVLKDLNKKTYKILNNENKVITKDLKYVNYAGYSNSLQALDKNNNVVYFDNDLKKIETPKEGIVEVCGAMAYFKRKIIEDDENYFIEFTEDNSVYSEGIKKSIVDTIPKKKLKKFTLQTRKKKLTMMKILIFQLT